MFHLVGPGTYILPHSISFSVAWWFIHFLTFCTSSLTCFTSFWNDQSLLKLVTTSCSVCTKQLRNLAKNWRWYHDSLLCFKSHFCHHWRQGPPLLHFLLLQQHHHLPPPTVTESFHHAIMGHNSSDFDGSKPNPNPNMACSNDWSSIMLFETLVLLIKRLTRLKV